MNLGGLSLSRRAHRQTKTWMLIKTLAGRNTRSTRPGAANAPGHISRFVYVSACPSPAPPTKFTFRHAEATAFMPMMATPRPSPTISLRSPHTCTPRPVFQVLLSCFRRPLGFLAIQLVAKVDVVRGKAQQAQGEGSFCVGVACFPPLQEPAGQVAPTGPAAECLFQRCGAERAPWPVSAAVHFSPPSPKTHGAGWSSPASSMYMPTCWPDSFPCTLRSMKISAL
eukprot:Skav210042  [mRNA]  locus=scaffold706:330381:331055:- [translate_table: standard]